MTVSLIAFPPGGGTVDENGIASTAHSAAKGTIGAVYTAWDSATNQWSMLAYYQAGATILQGDALIHDTSQYKSYRMIRAATANGGEIPRGFAAANVSNTAYYSYRYIGGYCPTIKFGSGVASNALCALSGSFTAGMDDFAVNATLGTSVFITARIGCVFCLDVMTTTGVNSGIIQGFLL